MTAYSQVLLSIAVSLSIVTPSTAAEITYSDLASEGSAVGLEPLAPGATPAGSSQPAAVLLGRRSAAQQSDDRQLSFTSSGGVNSLTFSVGYDPTELAIVGVTPAAGLPSTTRIGLETIKGKEESQARVTVTADDALPAGTIKLG